MAGPVALYSTTQTTAQTNFTVPFGLLSFVNSAIATATAAGEFNVTVDCSLFVTEDVSNLRIYLDSLGYKVEFAKNTNEKGLNIDWGTAILTGSGGGTVDQGLPNSLSNGWPVKITDGTSVLGTPSNPLVVTSDGLAGTDINEYAENATVSPSILTNVVTYVVPGGKTLKVTGFVGWGTYNGEFVVQVDGTPKGGGWTSAAEPTIEVDYSSGTILANAGQTVTVDVTHYATGSQGFKANLMGALQ